MVTNYRLWVALAGVVGLRAVVVHWAPLQRLFGATSLSPAEWAAAFGIASPVLFVEELRKGIARALHTSTQRER